MARETAALRLEPPPTDVPEADDSLVLLFMCAHPAMTDASAIALTLRAVGGLTTAEIASAFLVPEPTMAQRISRAKVAIRTSGVPFALPSADERRERLGNVQRVLYLVFNEGYASSGGASLLRVDLSAEAIRLSRLLHRLQPSEPEVAGLLALMLLIDARRAARVDARGDLVPLEEQDRRLWNRVQIAEGLALLDRAIGSGGAGEYQLQAAIAAVHDRAPRASDTDWPQILALYGLLEQLTGNPIVTLNRAVAVAMVQGSRAGLAILDTVADRVAGHYRVDAVRAHLLEMAGEREAAGEHYRRAASGATNETERRYLVGKAARSALPNAQAES